MKYHEHWHFTGGRSRRVRTATTYIALSLKSWHPKHLFTTRVIKRMWTRFALLLPPNSCLPARSARDARSVMNAETASTPSQVARLRLRKHRRYYILHPCIHHIYSYCTNISMSHFFSLTISLTLLPLSTIPPPNYTVSKLKNKPIATPLASHK